MFNWQYFIERDGLLYTENGERHEFDGAKRAAEEWDHYFGQNNIRASVERSESSRNTEDSSLKKTVVDTEERLGTLARSVASLGEQGVLDCPNCPNQGWYAAEDPELGVVHQVQCEFCCCEPRSRFNVQLNGSGS